MENRVFDIRNLLLLARADYASHKRGYIIYLLGLTLLAILGYIYVIFIINEFTNVADFYEIKYGVNNMINLFVIVFASSAFIDYNKKGGMSIFNMNLPASQAEKFSYIFIRNIIFTPALLFMINNILFVIFSLSHGHNISDNFSSMFTIQNVAAISALICITSYFFLMSILFKKKQFGIGMIIFIALSIASSIGAASYFARIKSIDMIQTFFENLGLGIAICISLTVIMTAISWYKFSKRLQIK